jgi:hypothetical protein
MGAVNRINTWRLTRSRRPWRTVKSVLKLYRPTPLRRWLVVVRRAFLAPDIVESIVQSRQPTSLPLKYSPGTSSCRSSGARRRRLWTFNNPGIGAEFLAHREKIEVTRHDSTCELSPVRVGQAQSAAHARFDRAATRTILEIGTREGRI